MGQRSLVSKTFCFPKKFSGNEFGKQKIMSHRCQENNNWRKIFEKTFCPKTFLYLGQKKILVKKILGWSSWANAKVKLHSQKHFCLFGVWVKKFWVTKMFSQKKIWKFLVQICGPKYWAQYIFCPNYGSKIFEWNKG